MITEINTNVTLSKHFKLDEFLHLGKYPENIPSVQDVVNMTYGCHQLLEPARIIVGSIIINSGFRCDPKTLPSSSAWSISSSPGSSPTSSSPAAAGSTSPGTPSPLPAISSGSITISETITGAWPG